MPSDTPLGLKTVEFDLAANEQLAVAVRGHSLIVRSLTGTVHMKVDGRNETKIEQGDTFEMPEGYDFTSLEFQEMAGSTASVKLKYGDGKVGDISTVISESVKVNNGDTLNNNAVNVATGATPTEIVASSSSRNAVVIYNNDASETVYVGKQTGLTTSTGLPIKAGASLTLGTGAAIYGIHAGAGNVNVRYIEVSD